MYRDIELAKALSKLPILKEVDELKHQVDALRPLSREVEERVLQKFRLDWNYHSNAIEGNPYTYGETVAFLMEGITAKGKTLKDHLDIKGHDDAIHYLLGVVKDKDYRLTESEMRGLHKMLLKEPYFSDAVTPGGVVTRKEIQLGAYKSTPNHVKTPTGAIHYYTSPEETPIKMGELVEWFNKASDNSEVHPVVVASLFHHQFTSIHPFDDGNGRMARLLMNLSLMQSGYPPIVIKQQDRNNYYQVLRQADAGEYHPLVIYIVDVLINSLQIYLKGARGEAIEEVEDIDKEILLFKRSFSEDKISLRKNSKTNTEILRNSIVPLFKKLKHKVRLLEDLFIKVESGILYRQTESHDFLNELRVDEIPNQIDLQEVRIFFRMTDFKKVDFPLAYTIQVSWIFDLLHYKIANNTFLDKNYQKRYGDELSSSEIDDIVATILKKTMKELEGYAKGIK
jgi:Fic family protein